MVKESKVGDKTKSINRKLSKGRKALQCVGDICYNPDTGKIEVHLDRKSCSTTAIEGYIEKLTGGTAVEFVIPSKKEATVKNESAIESKIEVKK